MIAIVAESPQIHEDASSNGLNPLTSAPATATMEKFYHQQDDDDEDKNEEGDDLSRVTVPPLDMRAFQPGCDEF